MQLWVQSCLNYQNINYEVVRKAAYPNGCSEPELSLSTLKSVIYLAQLLWRKSRYTHMYYIHTHMHEPERGVTRCGQD